MILKGLLKNWRTGQWRSRQCEFGNVANDLNRKVFGRTTMPLLSFSVLSV